MSTLEGCAITSPHWDYEPASTSAPIPFQAWSPSANALYIECAEETSAHGAPSGESYIAVATLQPGSSPLVDSAGQSIYGASLHVALPTSCWDYFGDYDFWQANVRVVMIDEEGKKVPFTSYDQSGLACLYREITKAGRWNGHVNKNCEYRLSDGELAPYVVLRIEGYQNGLS
ncbi:MAG: hypothetical protein ABW352_25745 [Polyangiales bacterium]